MPSGFKISKNRKNPNPRAIIHGFAVSASGGRNANAVKIPAASSMTIQPGSSVCVSFIALFTKGMATKNVIAARSAKHPEKLTCKSGQERMAASKLPKVPGAFFARPEPKKVTTSRVNLSVLCIIFHGADTM